MEPPVTFLRDGKPVRAAVLLCTEAGRDGREELVAFGKRIGLRETWLKNRGTLFEHFELRGARIEEAAKAGAIRVDRKRLQAVMRKKREQLGLVTVPRAVIRARTAVREGRLSRGMV